MIMIREGWIIMNETKGEITKEKPVKEGERIKILITHEGMKGDGISRKEGFAIITKKADKGKTYEVEITGVYSTYAFARILREIKTKKKEENEDEEIIEKPI